MDISQTWYQMWAQEKMRQFEEAQKEQEEKEKSEGQNDNR